MDSSVLVDDQIEEGASLVRALDEVIQVPVAFWYRYPDSGDWRLVLAGPAVDEYGARHVYGRVQELTNKLSLATLTPSNISLVRTDDLLVQLMSSTLTTASEIQRLRVGPHSAMGVMLGESVVYRLPSEGKERRRSPDYSEQVASARAFFAANDLLEPFWEVVFQPPEFKSQRVTTVRELRDIRARLHTSLRGWDFPHLDSRSDRNLNSGIQSATKSRYHQEAHRFYKSGLFIWRRRFQEEYEEGYLQRVMLVGNLFQFTEWLSAAADYGAAMELSSVELRIRAVGFANRELWDPKANIAGDLVSVESNFEWRGTLDPSVLWTNDRATARQIAGEFFELFGFDARDDLLEFWQQELPPGNRPSRGVR